MRIFSNSNRSDFISHFLSYIGHWATQIVIWTLYSPQTTCTPLILIKKAETISPNLQTARFDGFHSEVLELGQKNIVQVVSTVYSTATVDYSTEYSRLYWVTNEGKVTTKPSKK